jgi:hypothetical protein
MTTRDVPADPSGSARTSFGAEQGAGGRVAEQARDAGQQARDTAQKVASQAQSRVKQQVDARTTQVGEQIASTANDVRGVGEELRKQGKDAPARLADQVAERVEQVAEYMKDADADTMLADLENIARQRPWVVVAGGIALGFAASRFLKASSTERYSSRSESSGDYPYRASYDAPVTRTAVVESGTVPAGERSDVWDEERIGDIGTGRQTPGVSADL